tara:strand:+ start:723 stop:1013 length:291 start_codon:yes stop_codon:yes gene_type:complete
VSENSEDLLPPQGTKMSVVATATFTKDSAQRALMQSIELSDEQLELLKDQQLSVFYQWNPHHQDAFCLLTLAKPVDEDEDDDQTGAKSPFSSDSED